MKLYSPGFGLGQQILVFEAKIRNSSLGSVHLLHLYTEAYALPPCNVAIDYITTVHIHIMSWLVFYSFSECRWQHHADFRSSELAGAALAGNSEENLNVKKKTYVNRKILV